MSLKERVSIQSPTTTYDSEGVASNTWTTLEEVEGTLLPYGNALALKEYGFSEDVKYRFFYKGQNANLVRGNRILFGSTALPIVYVANYKKVLDVLLNTSQEN